MQSWHAVVAICTILIAIGGAMVAIPRIIKGVKSFAGFVAAMDKVTPVLIQIGLEFSQEHDGSLKQQIDEIKNTLKTHTETLSQQNTVMGRHSLILSKVDQAEKSVIAGQQEIAATVKAIHEDQQANK